MSDSIDPPRQVTSLIVIQTIIDKLFREEKSNIRYQKYLIPPF